MRRYKDKVIEVTVTAHGFHWDGKDYTSLTAVACAVTMNGLFGAARIVNSRYFVPFESYITAGLFYLVLTFTLIWVFKKMEYRWHAYLRPRET